MHGKLTILGAALAALLLTAPAHAGTSWRPLHDQAIEALETGDESAATDLLSQAKQIADDNGEGHLFFERSMVQLARAEHRRGRYEQATRHYETAIRVRQTRLGGNHADLVPLLEDLAQVRSACGDHDEAATLLKQVLHIQRQELGFSHPKVAETLLSLGWTSAEAGRCDDAEQYYRRSLAITDPVAGDSTAVAAALAEAAAVQTAKERYTNASNLYRRALKLQLAMGSPEDAGVRAIYARLGDLHSRLGDFQQAEWDYEHACRGSSDDELARRVWVAKIRLGKWDEADRFLRRFAARSDTKPRDAWSQELMCFLLGEITEDDLLATAGRHGDATAPQRMTQAYYYIASKQLAEGREHEASRLLKYCLDSATTGPTIQRNARAMLRQFEHDARLTNVDPDGEFPSP